MNEDKLATLYTAHVTVLKLVHDRALELPGSMLEKRFVLRKLASL